MTHIAGYGTPSPYPCETCGGPVVVVKGEPFCVRDESCIHDPGCDGRSHSLPCNNAYYDCVGDGHE